MKRSPEQAMKAVDDAKKLIKDGMPVQEALEKLKIASGTWQKYKDKRKSYTKTPVSIKPIEAPPMSLGGKTLLIISDDKDMINSILERFA
jgi:hypothetical protein